MINGPDSVARVRHNMDENGLSPMNDGGPNVEATIRANHSSANIHHLTMVYDLATERVTLYQDAPDGPPPVEYPWAPLNNDELEDAHVYIGNEGVPGNLLSNGLRGFIGAIYDAALFCGAITSEQISLIVSAGPR